MYKYVLKRLLMMIPVLIGVSFLVFFILAVSPGDPTRMILGQQASESAVQAMREELGLDHNLFVRYFDYMTDALKGDFGTSWKLCSQHYAYDTFQHAGIHAAGLHRYGAI